MNSHLESCFSLISWPILFTDESDEEGEVTAETKEEWEMGVVQSWMEVGGFPALYEREVQSLLHEVLVFVQHNSISFFLDYAVPILWLSLTCQIMFLFLLSGFGFVTMGEKAKGGGTTVGGRRVGQDSVRCDRIRGRGLYGLLWGPMLHSSMTSIPLTQKAPPISKHHHLHTPTRLSGSYT